MKPICIVLSPTRSRPLNIFLGILLLLSALLLLFSLATYCPADPSLNTASSAVGPHAVHNWIGLFGASLGDLLMQTLGVSAFLLPLWLGGLGWTWMRSRPSGLVWLRWIGVLLALTFLPAVLALLPWHWLWIHAVPVEGVVGKLMAGVLVTYLNIQGAWIVAGVLTAAGLYFATAVSFSIIVENLQSRWSQAISWHDRWHNWREERAELKAGREALRNSESDTGENLPESEAAFGTPPGLFARFFRRRKRPEIDPEEIPAFQRARIQPGAEDDASAEGPHIPSIWERAAAAPASPVAAIPVATIPGAAVAAAAAPVAAVAATMHPAPARPQFAEEHPLETPGNAYAQPQAAPVEPYAPIPPAPLPSAPLPFADEIAVASRTDAEMSAAAAVAPRKVNGFKLPPTTLLNAGDGPQAVREDELRKEAQVLVEKCDEFDVRGQVVQINPGPMVTTYEFKPEAGVKYSRVTGLADDLCLAMRAESILIARIPGKNTVGIQVPNQQRETIHLRDCLESEVFKKAKSRLTIAMGKDINGRIVTADLAGMPHVLIAGSDRLRQVGGHQRHDYESVVSHHARAGAAHSRRSQTRRTGNVRRNSSSFHSYHYGAETGCQRSAQRRPRNGAASETVGQPQRAQHRPVQQALRGHDAFAVRLGRGRRAAALHCHHHRRTVRPDDARTAPTSRNPSLASRRCPAPWAFTLFWPRSGLAWM